MPPHISRLTAFCLLILATALLTACSSKPESAIKTFYNAVAAGDVDKATEQISFASIDAKEMMQAKGKIHMIVGELKEQIDANDGLKAIEVLESNIEADNGKARVRLLFNNGKNNIGNYELVREDGEWKMKLF